MDKAILWVVAVGALIGAVDRITGNHLKLGEQFDEGFKAMGTLALGMVGIVCMAPVFAKLAGPVLTPVFGLFGADPAMIGSFIANDMGGYQLSMELAQDHEAGLYAGTMVASMLGCTLAFSVPVGFSVIEQEDRPYYSKGLLIGLIAIPFGSLIGGLAAGFETAALVKNTLPVLVAAVLLAVGLKLIPEKMIKGSMIFGKIVMICGYVGIACGAFEHITGVAIIPGMTDILVGMSSVVEIAIVLIGTLPVLTLLMKVLNKPLDKLGKKLGLDAVSAAGIIFSLANSVPVFTMMKDMKKRGIILNTAWLVTATAVFGDHLGFTAAVEPTMITPVIIAKLAAGFIALGLSFILTRNMSN